MYHHQQLHQPMLGPMANPNNPSNIVENKFNNMFGALSAAAAANFAAVAANNFASCPASTSSTSNSHFPGGQQQSIPSSIVSAIPVCGPSFVPPPPLATTKRERTKYSEYQLAYLEGIFCELQYPDSAKREEIARILELTDVKVQVWFKNRRAKAHLSQQSQISPNELAVQRLTQSGDHFLDRIGQMRQSLEEIDRLIRQMLQIQETILGQTAVRPEDKHQLDGMIEQIQRRATILRQGVRTLETELASEVDINGVGANARRRIRQNQADQLRRRLNEVIETFHSAQEEYRQRVTRRVKRQLELAGEYLEPGEVERLLEDKSEQIFYRHINPANIAAQMALDDASNRHSELLKLEKSIAELGECFRDMFELVHSQGQMVDRIETNVQSAVEYTGQARVQMHRAVTYKKSAQRLKCIIILVVTGLLLILLLILAISFGFFMPHFH